MNYTKCLIAALVLLTTIVSCKKGDTGPAGNANVIQYNFGSQTFTGVLNLTLSNISQGKIDSSMVLIYYNPSTETSTAWYPVPGLGSGGLYEMRYLIYQGTPSPSSYIISLRANKPDGSGTYASALTFTKIRVFIVPASSVLPGGRQAAPVDYSDYYAVKKYYNIPD